MNTRQKIFARMKGALLNGDEKGIFIAPWFSGQFTFFYADVLGKTYYSDMRVKHKAQIEVMQHWPEVFFAPGLRYDFGVVTEASAFGCQIKFPENDSPVIEKHPVSSIDDIKTLKVPDPHKDGLYPQALETLAYMMDNTDPELIEGTGILQNSAYVLGPMEQAAQVCGYEQFFVGMYKYPEVIKDLLKKTTENAIKWVKAQSEVVGRPKIIYLIDHMASLISASQFEQFGVQGIKSIFAEFEPCIGLYHNEGKVEHNLCNIKKIGARIFHFALDLEKTRNELGRDICLMGNLSPLEVLKKGSPEQVRREAEGLISLVSDQENFILSSGGGLAGNTPPENIDAMVKVVTN